MAPKDYVARDKVPAKKTPAKKRGSGPSKSAGRGNSRKAAAKNNVPAAGNLPLLRIAFTLLILIGFGVFLWNIKESADTRRTEQQAAVEAKRQAEAKKQDDLPEMPEEKWEFIETLTDPNYEVKVELPDQPQTADKEYVMQCGSFRKQQQAEGMRAKIAFQGLESSIRESNGKNGRWYRVVLGPYQRKRAAEKDRHTLQRAGFTTCRIW